MSAIKKAFNSVAKTIDKLVSSDKILGKANAEIERAWTNVLGQETGVHTALTPAGQLAYGHTGIINALTGVKESLKGVGAMVVNGDPYKEAEELEEEQAKLAAETPKSATVDPEAERRAEAEKQTAAANAALVEAARRRRQQAGLLLNGSGSTVLSGAGSTVIG
jgi:hypothetical protein